MRRILKIIGLLILILAIVVITTSIMTDNENQTTPAVTVELESTSSINNVSPDVNLITPPFMTNKLFEFKLPQMDVMK